MLKLSSISESSRHFKFENIPFFFLRYEASWVPNTYFHCLLFLCIFMLASILDHLSTMAFGARFMFSKSALECDISRLYSLMHGGLGKRMRTRKKRDLIFQRNCVRLVSFYNSFSCLNA